MDLHLQYRMRRKFVLEHVENLRSRINQRGTPLGSAEGVITYLAPRIHFPIRQKALDWELDTDLLWTKCRARLEPQVPQSVGVDAGVWGSPHLPRARPHPAPALAGPIRVLPWLPTHRLRLPEFGSGPSAARAS